MNNTKAEIVAHSVNPWDDELISVLATFPRPILAEMNTHRMLSKNTSSSRAIPFLKMVEAVQNNPFIPIAFQKEHSGMQGTEYWEGEDHDLRVENRKKAISRSIDSAKEEHHYGVTKQLANRHLEPHMWTTMLITGSRQGWDNFFHLRCPQYLINDKFVKSRKDWNKLSTLNGGINYNEEDDLHWLKMNSGQAEIHMMALAEAIWDSVNESTPKQLKPGEWHIPFEDKIGRFSNIPLTFDVTNLEIEANILMNKIKIGTAMAARTSYTLVGEEKEVNWEGMINLHDRLITQEPPHSSPMEHCSQCMTEFERLRFTKGIGSLHDSDVESLTFEENSKGWCYNIKGFIPYRYLIDNNLTL